MSGYRFNSSPPDRWTSPRPHQDPSARLRTHGPIRPLPRPGLLRRLLQSAFSRRSI